LYVHPFAEEMNKTRRMAAEQARRFAALGFAVLQIDLFGCGDSAGEIGDVRVEVWMEDLDVAAAWMAREGYAPLHVWGLRFGALLAATWTSRRSDVVGLMLWQPVPQGETHLTQFLRMAVASEMLGRADKDSARGGLRARLAAGDVVEVAGYEIAPEFAQSFDRLRLTDVAPAGSTIDWVEIVQHPTQALPPASARIVERWRASGCRVEEHTVVGDPFWTTVEITDCPALIERTTRIVTDRWNSSLSSVP
jgi:exosortase A-associated hydrolase 2